MKHIQTLIAAVAVSGAIYAVSAQAQIQLPIQQDRSQVVYAMENCRAGCVYNDHQDSLIYHGAVAKSYRVCASDAFSVRVKVDDQILETPSCADVNGRSIWLLKGRALIGRLPD